MNITTNKIRPQHHCVILCGYVNDTDQFQVVRIPNTSQGYLERVISPRGYLIFEAFPEAKLEVNTGTTPSAILSDRIRCDRLRLISQAVSEDIIALSCPLSIDVEEELFKRDQAIASYS